MNRKFSLGNIPVIFSERDFNHINSVEIQLNINYISLPAHTRSKISGRFNFPALLLDGIALYKIFPFHTPTLYPTGIYSEGLSQQLKEFFRR